MAYDGFRKWSHFPAKLLPDFFCREHDSLKIKVWETGRMINGTSTEDKQARVAVCGEPFDIAMIQRLLPALAKAAENSISRQWQSKASVSDIIQDTLLEASQSLPTFGGSTIGEFNQWLRQILSNNVKDARRKFVDAQKRSTSREQSLEYPLPCSDPSPSRMAMTKEFDGDLHQAIESLGKKDRTVLTLRYQQQLTFVAIGARLGMKEDTVRKRWGRILVTLQRQLESHESRLIHRLR